ncbi:MAG: hypothetical protein LQ340_005185 [Diploschistes diacapsis]|nr:MAG: hypothetical protein LQ340_005185 [Diploschistes diacapsis]
MIAEPQVLPGPEVNGRQTKMYLFEADQLAASHMLPSFLPPINAAFSANHPPYLPASLVRLRTTDEFRNELGPEAFTYGLVYADDTEEAKDILATVSGKPFRWLEPEVKDPEYRTFYYDKEHAGKPNTETWELKLMVVDPNLQRNGLASLMLGLVETEIRRRFEEKKLLETKISQEDGRRGNTAPDRKLRLLLQTLYEMNGEFYRKRGWTLIGNRKRERGCMGSEVGFHVATLDKVFDF